LRIFAITELAILRLYAAQQGFTKSFAIPPELRSTSSSSGLELSTRRSATVGGSPRRRRAGPHRICRSTTRGRPSSLTPRACSPRPARSR